MGGPSQEPNKGRRFALRMLESATWLFVVFFFLVLFGAFDLLPSIQ